ncbi:MAG TPA: alkaline phosphatase PhoX [Gemmatimonadaceae bacterium]
MDRTILHVAVTALLVPAFSACGDGALTAAIADERLPNEPGIVLHETTPGNPVPFAPLPASAACIAGGDAEQILLPAGYVASVVAREGAGYPDLADMNTVNETGPRTGRFLYRTHEIGSNGAVSVTDLLTGLTRIVAQRADWERLDGIAWTPWGTIIAAEEATTSAAKDPTLPNAVGGHVYEIDPATGNAALRAALGARSHEGIRFDKRGNVYGISETSPGFIFKFVPDHRNDLSSGQLFALKIVTDLGNSTGWGAWIALDRNAVVLDAQAEAVAKGATGYSRPEDVEIGTSTGDDRRGNSTLFVAITGEDRVLAINLAPGSGKDGQVFVSDYVKDGVNAPSDFDSPDNLALDRAGNLYISEDPGGNAAGGKTLGDDVWFAPFNQGSAGQSLPIQRFLTITDCDAEPTGIYLSPSGRSLFVNVQHRGGADPRDLSYAIWRLDNINFNAAAK